MTRARCLPEDSTHPYEHVLVTGGAGFIGSHLCAALLADGCRVTCMDSFLTGLPENIAPFRDHPAFHLMPTDATRPMRSFEAVDLVLHFASPASPADYMRYPIETLTVGSIGTLHALEHAADHGARFVLASTSEVYGDPLVHPQPESYWGNVNPVGPRGVYDEAKRFAEALTTAYRTARRTNTAIVRIFNTFGPRMRSSDGRAIPTFIRQALGDEPLTVTGDGRQTRSVCYVDDTVRGVLAVADSDLDGPVNVGSPDEMSVLEIARRIIEVTGSQSTIQHIPAMVDDPRVRRPDITLIESKLGWRPVVDWDEGIRRTVDWFRARIGAAR
jgi:dTDP-glucose 4,6-dehydratase